MSLLDSLKNLFAGNKAEKSRTPIDVKGRFTLLCRTGQGSMSKVWRAQDKRHDRLVCLKLLDKAKTAKFEARFQGKAKKPNEGAICIDMKHPNIVETLEYGVTTEGEPYLVLELIDGSGLNYLLETKSQQLNGNRVKFLIHVADALHYVHGKGYLHRDICPRNVMVTKSNVAKLIDFGLAVPNTAEFLKPGNRTGTPDYLAPEIIRRAPTDQRVDLFALGVTAYEVFTYNLPWEKQADSMQTFLNHINTPGRDPREFVPELHKKTAEVLVKGIERDPRTRFQSAAEFRDALRGLPQNQ